MTNRKSAKKLKLLKVKSVKQDYDSKNCLRSPWVSTSGKRMIIMNFSGYQRHRRKRKQDGKCC